MPELPEVEVAARNLRRWAVGRKVRGVRADRRAAASSGPPRPGRWARSRGRGFRRSSGAARTCSLTLAPSRRGGRVGVWSHLGMTGKWLHRRAGEDAPRFERLRIDLDDGTSLRYADLRLFGRFRMVPDARFESLAGHRARSAPIR